MDGLQTNYYKKYIKYKTKYLELLQIGGCEPGKMLQDFADTVLKIINSKTNSSRIRYIIYRIKSGESCNIFWVSDKHRDSIAKTGESKYHIDMFVSDSCNNKIGFKLSIDGLPQNMIQITSTDNPDYAARAIYSILN